MNRETFFAYAKRAPFGGRLTQAQVDGLNKILDHWEVSGATDERWLAYMLATTFHETGGRMQPVREMGGEKYLRSKKYYPWVGEGLVQVTWETNHRKFGATKPGQLMTWPIALRALFDGMIKGMFTGKKLADYFNAETDDPIGARRIVNGTDKAKLIAGYHNSFLGAITAAHDPVQPADVSPEQAAPDDKPPEKSGTFWTVISTMFGGALTSLLAVDNVWGFAVAAMLLVGGGVALWAFGTGRLQILRSKAL